MAHSAGFYIGSDFVDLVVMDALHGKPRIIKSVRSTFQQEDVGMVSPAKQQADRAVSIGTAVKDTLEAAGININSVSFGFSQEEVVIRNFKMPWLNAEDRADGVKFEALKCVPFKLDAIISDFYVTRESKDSKSMDIFFVGVNKQAADKYINIFKELKIGLNVGDIEPLALLRLLNHCNRISVDKTQVLLYAEKDAKISIVVVDDGNPYLAKTVNAAASSTTFPDTVLNNLRLSIDYFKRETKQLLVNKIVLCGEGKLAELQAYLKENMPGAEIDIFEPETEIAGLNDLSRKQIVAAGVALAAFDKPKPRINLFKALPKPLTLDKVFKEYRPLFAEAGALVIILILLQILMGGNVDGYKKQLAKIKEAMVPVRGVRDDVTLEAIKGIEGNFKNKITFFNSLVGSDRVYLTKKLNALSGIIPAEALIESFQFTQETGKQPSLIIDGVIYSRDKEASAIANKILVDMKQSQDFSFGFDSIELESMKKTAAYGKQVLAFSIQCTGAAPGKKGGAQ